MKLNISLAWERVKKDFKEKNFIAPVSLIDIVEYDKERWITLLQNKIQSGTYYPEVMEIVEVPKAKGLIRPGSLLTPIDNIFYSALVHECYLNILDHIQWSQNKIDFAYIPTKNNAYSTDWYKNQFLGWTDFRNKSLEIIKSGSKYVILTDITGFYENIDISILISDLKVCGVDIEIINNIGKCLNKWCKVNGKGIPQGNSASDLLAKLYLDVVDQSLQNAGFKHLRYVDDIRIFCNNGSEAKKALIELSRILRKRGLNLQSAKTKILPSTQASKEIRGFQPLIEAITEKIKCENINLSSYSNESEISDGTSLESIKETMKTFFIEDREHNFDKTLFHFLINRLIKEKESFALDFCLTLLIPHPEETNFILKYTESLNEHDENFFESLKKIFRKLLFFLQSEDAVYDYQNYLILSWLGKHAWLFPVELSVLCRNFAYDNNKPYYLRSIACDILGRNGNNADLDKLEDHLNSSTNETEKAELLCCLTKMEKSKRNSLLGRIGNQSSIMNMAVDFVKGR